MKWSEAKAKAEQATDDLEKALDAENAKNNTKLWYFGNAHIVKLTSLDLFGGIR